MFRLGRQETPRDAAIRPETHLDALWRLSTHQDAQVRNKIQIILFLIYVSPNDELNC